MTAGWGRPPRQGRLAGDDEAKRRIYTKLDKIYMQNVTDVPLMYRPLEFFEYNDSTWTGWPNSKHPDRATTVLRRRIMWLFKIKPKLPRDGLLRSSIGHDIGRGRGVCMGLSKYLLRKSLWYLGALFAALVLNFFLPRLVPGNPVDAIIADMSRGGGVQGEQLEAIHQHYMQEFGLDQAAVGAVPHLPGQPGCTATWARRSRSTRVGVGR